MISIYKKSRGRRAKNKQNVENKVAKRSPGALRIQIDMDELELPGNVKLTIPNPENLLLFHVELSVNEGYWKGGIFHFDVEIPEGYNNKVSTTHGLK